MKILFWGENKKFDIEIKSEIGLLNGVHELRNSGLEVEINYHLSQEPEKKAVYFHKIYERRCDVENKIKSFKTKHLIFTENEVY